MSGKPDARAGTVEERLPVEVVAIFGVEGEVVHPGR